MGLRERVRARSRGTSALVLTFVALVPASPAGATVAVDVDGALAARRSL